MIQRLRNRFICIATLSVAAVMLLLTVVLNTANYLSTDADLKNMLALIGENQGTIPVSGRVDAPDGGGSQDRDGQPPRPPEQDGTRNGPFTPETPYSTRYFVLFYTDDGALTQADLSHISSVTTADTGTYLAAAQARGAGYGHCGSYRFYVTDTDSGLHMAIFLDVYQQLRAVRSVAVWSLLADAGCIALVFLLVVIFSRKAIDPVVRSAQRQKQFITDASHELKTPITVIATSLKVLEMETGKQKWIDKAQAQTEKLTELVNALVTLSRMDEEDSPLKAEPFPISAAVTETAESFRDFAVSNGHALALSIQPELSYTGDEYAVRQLVSILLDNAVKYAAADTPIALRLEKARRGVTLCVENSCTSLDKADLDRLFDRFYRVNDARSGGPGGFGIGLSIARGIAEGHHGAIRARQADGRILFTVELK